MNLKIKKIKTQLPGCVKQVLFRADDEFFNWESISACIEEGFRFIIANKGARPPFDPTAWYRPKKRKPYEFNSCVYKSMGGKTSCRFVAMRIPKELKAPRGRPVQCELFVDDRFTYRIFCTSLKSKPHKVIAKYDKRADVENLVGEAKRESLDAIPSALNQKTNCLCNAINLSANIVAKCAILNQQSY